MRDFINTIAQKIVTQPTFKDNLDSEITNHNFSLLEIVEELSFWDIIDVTQSVVIIFDHKNNKVEFISHNVEEILGIAKNTILAADKQLLYNHYHPSHCEFPNRFMQELGATTNANDDGKGNVLITACGLKFCHSKKGIIRTSVQQYFINEDANCSVLIVRDISHLVKGDSYFIRTLFGCKHQYVRAYHNSTLHANAHNDIITERENDVLKLLAHHKDSDEIAQTLSISRNTVRNHRQNMLDRIGVKDTTALLEIAFLCHLI